MSSRPAPAPQNPATTPVEVAASLQSTCHGWLIMWSPWRRVFTAFSAITPERVIIDETTVDRLLTRIGEIERAMFVKAPPDSVYGF